MAQYNSKVQLADGTTLIDLTGDTVAANVLRTGYTAHSADGAPITGTFDGGEALPDLDALTFGAEGQQTFEGKTDGANYQAIAEAINARMAAGGPIGGNSLSIYLRAPVGAVVTAKKDENLYAGVVAASGESECIYRIDVPEYGSYFLKATLSGSVYVGYGQAGSDNIYDLTHAVPNDIILLEWLESTGAQSLSMGGIPDANVSYEVQAAVTDLDAPGLSGTSSATSINMDAYFGFDGEESLISAMRIGDSPFGQAAKIPVDTEFHDYYLSNGYQSVDRAPGSMGANGSKAYGRNFLLFCLSGQSSSSYAKMKISYSNLIINHYAQMAWIPAKSADGSLIGMFNAINNSVNGMTYASVGFIAGPEISL